ncbi:transcriptional regulator, BadM/Rrf2 family [Salegentibacter holothuriorum]|uniref:Transcriptional regulator, BadM/Rrf2 family n=2 Tax=Salegentibacter holothuriorum TaxID=241145 RepID=A0A1T5DT49_9FLAO|nr:transcriptional regulator, BadM/Rrf2 family [Salegentibacter holothuriorum]
MVISVDAYLLDVSAEKLIINVKKSIFEYIRNMLSKKTKYGIKALAFIAKKSDRKPVQTSEISKSENISQKFLESILLELRKSGFLGSKKGKGGGYYLIKEPESILMTAVIRVLEGPIAMVPCVSLNYYEKCDDCPSEETCSVHSLMIQVRDSTLKVLGDNTLADISAKK